MESSPHTEAVLAFLRARADAQGAVGYADFTRAALYLPQHGYYASDRRRVGKAADTDFYTASSLGGDVFARLLLESFETLLGRDFCETATLVEIGAEPERALFARTKGVFKDTRVLRLGEPLAIPPRAVVFANEWLDAQPFLRLRKTRDGWEERGVDVRATPVECTLAQPTPEARAYIAARLGGTEAVPVGTLLDVSPAAEEALRSVCAQAWQGAFITADYGRDFAALLTECPSGTARAYAHHRVSGDLCADPAQRDLTVDVCWDAAEAVLRACAFSGVQTLRQEVFFMKNAPKTIADIVQNAPALSPQKRALAELLHPCALGARFQIMSGQRRRISPL